MSGDIMMALGGAEGFQFSLNTAAYGTLKRKTEWRWPKVERLEKGPARQSIGPGDDTMTLEGVIYPHFRGGVRQIEKMRALAGKGEPLALVDGMGYAYGLWCIEAVEETASAFLSNGAPRKMEFTLSLGLFVEDAR